LSKTSIKYSQNHALQIDRSHFYVKMQNLSTSWLCLGKSSVY